MGTLWLSVVFLLVVPTAFAAEILTNDGITAMARAGVAEEIVLEKIRTSPGQYDLSVQGIVQLKQSGVSDAVVKAMMEASAPSSAPAAGAGVEAVQAAIALYRQEKVVEAEAAFDRLLVQSPGDDGLKVWKALAILEQARVKKDAEESGYKPLVVKAYAVLQPLGRRMSDNADWNYAMAKAFWLNDRPTWAGRASRTAFKLRPNFAEPQILLGDLAYDSDAQDLAMPARSPQRQTAMMWLGVNARKEYEKALAIPGLGAPLQAEVLYKLGKVAADLEKQPAIAREYWSQAVAADAGCRYGAMAQKRLQAAPGK
jgi:tetratricopeptide (TPR) repeat protein